MLMSGVAIVKGLEVVLYHFVFLYAGDGHTFLDESSQLLLLEWGNRLLLG